MPRISAPQPTSLRGGPRPRPPYADHSMDTYDNLSLLHLISCAFRIRSVAVAVDNRGYRTRGYGETSPLDRPCRPTLRAKLLACSAPDDAIAQAASELEKQIQFGQTEPQTLINVHPLRIAGAPMIASDNGGHRSAVAELTWNDFVVE